MSKKNYWAVAYKWETGELGFFSFGPAGQTILYGNKPTAKTSDNQARRGKKDIGVHLRKNGIRQPKKWFNGVGRFFPDDH